MLHGYNDRYHKDDILKHINMLDIPGESTLNYLLGPDCNEKDENGNEWTKESFFSKYIPNNFLKSRSKLLLGLRDGLSIGGSSDPSEDCLEQGCGLTSIFSLFPIEAIKHIHFAKPYISLEDLLSVLQPKFGEGGKFNKLHITPNSYI